MAAYETDVVVIAAGLSVWRRLSRQQKTGLRYWLWKKVNCRGNGQHGNGAFGDRYKVPEASDV